MEQKMEELFALIRQLIIEAAELDDVEIGVDEQLADHEVDSLAGLEVTVNLEKKYQVKIPPERYEEMTSIRSIATIVSELISAKAAAEQVSA